MPSSLSAAPTDVAAPPQSTVLPPIRLAPWLLAAGVLTLAWLGLWNKLRVDWTINDQYQYGWCVPPLALALLALRWPDRPPPALLGWRPSGWVLALLSGGMLLLLWPVRLIEEPNPDWRLLYWFHAGLLTALSLALLLWMGGWPWVRHFALPVGFLLLAVPWPSGPEQAIVQSLMRVVAHIAAEGMNVLGIPASAEGNLIHVRDQTLGVDEACSGIRSLQTMLMGALLFGELSRLTWPRRSVLLGGGIGVAMLANVFRSSLLVWITANHGTVAMERFHDAAGISVLLIVFAGLMGINSLLGRGNGNHPSKPATFPENPPAVSPAMVPRRVPAWCLAAAVLWLIAGEAGTVAWYHLGTSAGEPMPRWTVAPPDDAPGFTSNKIDARTSQMLRFDQGISARWSRPGVPLEDCTLFFFHWEPGHASAAQADMHQPHICLTASGLTQIADWGIRPLELADGITLPVRRYEFALHGRSIYVFFVVWQDGVGAQTLANAPGTRWSRLEPVFGHRANRGRQTLEFIVAGSADAGQANVRFEQEIATMVRPLSSTRSLVTKQ